MAEAREKYLHDFCDKDFENVTNLGLKVIDGTQYSKPILKVFYHDNTHELKLVRHLDDWDNDMISLFGVFELNLFASKLYLFFKKLQNGEIEG